MATTKTTPREGRGRRTPLSRERILEEALRLVDEEGLRALTMRALGKRLGVDPMSVYNHVPGKAALGQGIYLLLDMEENTRLTAQALVQIARRQGS